MDFISRGDNQISQKWGDLQLTPFGVYVLHKVHDPIGTFMHSGFKLIWAILLPAFQLQTATT